MEAEMDLRLGGSRKMGKMTERLRKEHFERRRCGKGQNERIKEEQGNEKGTVKHGEQT
jgi:hypothetical protein